MAFTYAIKKQTFMGDLKLVIGTWDGASVTTGELDLSAYFSGKIYDIVLSRNSDAVGNSPTIDETFPLDSGTAATLVCVSNDKGIFEAKGEGV